MTEWFPVRVGLNKGSTLSPNMFDPIMDVLTEGIRDRPLWCKLFADDIAICCTSLKRVEQKVEAWRRALEDRLKNKQEENGVHDFYRGVRERLECRETF